MWLPLEAPANHRPFQITTSLSLWSNKNIRFNWAYIIRNSIFFCVQKICWVFNCSILKSMGTWVALACYLSFLYNKPYPKKSSSQKYHCYGILHASCIAQQPKSEFTSPEKSAHGVILLIYASQWIKRLRQAYHIATKTYKFGCTPHIGFQDKFL